MTDRPRSARDAGPRYGAVPNETTLVELPAVRYLRDVLGYTYVSPAQALALRGGENHVLLRAHLVDALVRLNGISQEDAGAIYSELSRLDDNERWLAILRGSYSRKVTGEATHRPIRLIDFEDPANNTFVVTNQLEVRGLSYRIPDVVVFVNGIPLVVIEAKSSLAKQDVFDAIDDIAVYERELPRLFFSNLFNVATNGLSLRYGATGSPKEFWATWPDAWPREQADFENEPMRLGLWALLDKPRLLDLLAHFVVFEKDGERGTSVKKICRYQQFRAVNKIVARVVEGKHRQGLVWHTQGSGKSLTMVFAALKLKFHRGIDSPALENPNLLVVTDRRELDLQITKTFQDCGIPNPLHAGSIEELRELVRGAPKGRVVLSTIFKAQDSVTPVERSDDWIVLVDEAHRTQEKDLGAYLRKTFPDARFFGFTGTPVKSKDLDTRKNFGVPGEAYLDRYGIEDAVADGATVPIRYMSRMALWDLDAAKLDVMFDQEFAALPEELRDELKARGVTRGDLARFEPRIALIAYDLWVHFKKNVRPDGMKAQIVAVDRKACTVYKRHLDAIIARELEREGVPPDEAARRAAATSACVYSSGGKDDLKPGNEDLVRFFLDEEAERDAIRRFKDPNDPLAFLIVCNKLLTGFDAPIEQAMYLDSPLTQHNLLQAIARTNRRYGPRKDHAIVVDYIGVTKDLKKALDSYDPADVNDAMASDDALVEELRRAHAAAMAFVKKAKRKGDPEADAKAACDAIGTEDVWYEFRTAAREFLRAQAAVGSRPERLQTSADAKYVASVVAYGTLRFEQKTEIDFKGLSEKIRGMLEEHLKVTGLQTLVTLPEITDPRFWYGLGQEESAEEDLETAALKKASALKKTLAAKAAQSPAQYRTLSERVQELIDSFAQKQIDAAELYRRTYEYAVELVRKEVEYEDTGLDRETHGFYAILAAEPAGEASSATSVEDGSAVHPSAKGVAESAAQTTVGHAGPALASSARRASERRFSEEGLRRLIARFAEWRHARCEDAVAPYALGGGDEAKARAALELLEAVANAPMPDVVTQAEGEEAYADLATRVVRAPERVVCADDPESEDLGPWIAFVFLGVEPLLLKVLALLHPEDAREALKKRVGLGTLVSALQQRARIPYALKLSPQEFEADEGWSARATYDNALRDVAAIRIAQAHKAPATQRAIWESALVTMLGVIEHDPDALRAALKATVESEVVATPRREAGPELTEREAEQRALAEELAKLFRDDATAPLNWQLNVAVQKELRRLARRVLMRSSVPREQRDAALDAVMDHAAQHFAKVRS